MSHHDARAERLPEQVDDTDTTASERFRAVDDVPAARLLAHDLEHLEFDDDGDGVLPPPD